MSFNKNTWDKDYSDSPGIKTLAKREWEAKKKKQTKVQEKENTDGNS